jgi:CubicO group peptidase (beta-lactamase class C family)
MQGAAFMRTPRFALSKFVIVVCAIAAFALAHSSAIAADAQPEWQQASAQSMGVDAATLTRLTGAVEAGRFPKTTSVLVVYRDRLIYEHYFGEGGRNFLNNTRSATKSITSLAIGAAIADHAISAVTAPAFAYLGDLAPFKNSTLLKQDITIADLLTMSSALDCDDDVDGSPGNEDRMHENRQWTRWVVDLPTKDGYTRDAHGLGPFSYCTAGAFLLGQIIERATRRPVDQYMEAKLLKPLGIAKWSWARSPSGEVMTGGGLELRSRDLAKLAWILVDNGRWRGREIVPAAWTNAAMTAYRRANAEQDYGYFFWQRTYATRCGTTQGWYMAGNGGNAIVVLKELDAAVVVTRENYNTHGMHQQTVDLLERFVLPALPCDRGP